MYNYLWENFGEKRIFDCGENCENCKNYCTCKFVNVNDNTPCQLYNFDEDEFCYCEDCGEIIEQDEAIYCQDTGRRYCPDCANNNGVIWCSDCEEYYERSYNHIYIENEDRYICEDCYSNGEYFHCEDCGAYYSGYCNTAYNENGSELTLCNSCFENTNYCDDCDIYYIGDYCPVCEENRRRLIKNYSYKPTPQFFGDYENNICYGVELETENNPLDFAEALKNSCVENHIYCKRDGSLDDGVEIVSHPADREALLNVYSEVMRIALNNEVVSWNNTNCGLHFHISRESLNKLYDNQILWESCLTFAFSIWQSELEKVSGRRSQHYCNYQHYCNFIDCYNNQESFDYDRYKAVNTCNRATIEIRSFKGTLSFINFKHRFNILEALIKAIANMLNGVEGDISKINDIFEKNSFVSFISDYLNIDDLSWLINELKTRRFK